MWQFACCDAYPYREEEDTYPLLLDAKDIHSSHLDWYRRVMSCMCSTRIGEIKYPTCKSFPLYKSSKADFRKQVRESVCPVSFSYTPLTIFPPSIGPWTPATLVPYLRNQILYPGPKPVAKLVGSVDENTPWGFC